LSFEAGSWFPGAMNTGGQPAAANARVANASEPVSTGTPSNRSPGTSMACAPRSIASRTA
jgi:hypothetical protein